MYEIISKKRDGLELTREEIARFVNGFGKGEIPDYQAAALLMAIYINGMNPREVMDLTELMLASGGTISLDEIDGFKVDKHSTGGVGDKVSFIVAPLAAAFGLKVPMISGRALGHSGGTLDKFESIPGLKVSFSESEFIRLVKSTGMAICGPTDNLVPADKKIYALRDSIAAVASTPLIVSSIMSKKLALGTDAIILDVKTGLGSFIGSEENAVALSKTMVEVGEKAGRKTIGLISKMDQPLGMAVGNALEIREALDTLKGIGPEDLVDVSLALTSCMLVAAGLEKEYGKAYKSAEKTLLSGKPFELFRNLIQAQGGNENVCDDYNLLPKSKIQSEFLVPSSGTVSEINALLIGLAVNEIGAGRASKEDTIDPGAGFVFSKKVGDEVEKGEPFLTIHCESEALANKARERLAQAITISAKPAPKVKMVSHRIDKTGVANWNI